MDIKHLRYFLVVAEERNFTHAANRLGIEPSPLSRAMSDLESRLGCKLLIRDRKGLLLTSAGNVLRDDARSVLASIEKIRERVESAAHGYRTQLRVGIADTLWSPRLSLLLARSREEEPEVEVRIEEINANALIKALRDHELDAGLCLYGVPGKGYQREPVWFDVPAVALPTRHPLLSKQRITLDDAIQYPLILCDPEELMGGHHAIDEWLHTAAPRSPTVAKYVATGHEAMLMLVAAGYGLAFVLGSQVTSFQYPNVVLRPIDSDNAAVHTYLLHRDAEPCPALSRFISRAREVGQSN